MGFIASPTTNCKETPLTSLQCPWGNFTNYSLLQKGRKSDHLGKTFILEDTFGAEEKQYIPCLAFSSCSVKPDSEDPKNLTFSLALFVRVRRIDMVYTMSKVCKEPKYVLLNSLIQLTKRISRHVLLAVSLAPFCQRANPVTLQTRDPLAAFPGSKTLFSGT